MLDMLVHLARLIRHAGRSGRVHRKLARKGVYIHPSTLFTVDHPGRIVLGEGVRIGEFNVIVSFDEDGDAAFKGSELRVGAGTYIGAQNNIRAAGGQIEIGRDCLISQQVALVASNHRMARGEPIQRQAWDTEKVGIIMGDDVWIGAQVVVLPGVRIGSGAVVAAGSVVTRDVEPNAIVAGVPARAVGERGGR